MKRTIEQYQARCGATIAEIVEATEGWPGNTLITDVDIDYEDDRSLIGNGKVYGCMTIKGERVVES